MKLNKIFIISLILLTILSLSAVSAANETDGSIGLDDDSLVELSDNNFKNEVIEVNNSFDNNLQSSDLIDEDLQTSDSGEDVYSENEVVVTSDNFFDYFTNEGSLKSKTNMTFQGEFNGLVNHIIIPYSVNIEGTGAVFKNMGVTIMSDNVKLNGLTFNANQALGNLIYVESSSYVTLSNLTITYNVGDVTSNTISLYDCMNSNILNNKITYSSQIISDENEAIVINILESNDISVDSNMITASYPMLYVTVLEGMGSTNLNTIRAKTCGKLIVVNNKIDVTPNAFYNIEYSTIQVMRFSDVSNSLIDRNNVSMIDNLCVAGDVNCLYGCSFSESTNLTISNNNFDLYTNGGNDAAGTAYPIHGASSDVRIIGNNLTSKSKGPNIGIYIAGMGGEDSKQYIENNKINVTGLATTYSDWALVSGIEIQLGESRIYNNIIYSQNIGSYNDNNYMYGISYAQWINGERSFDIQNNTIVTQGKYSISTIATKKGESTPLIAKNNSLHAHSLVGDDSIFTNGINVTVLNNTDVSGIIIGDDNETDSNATGGNSTGSNGTEINPQIDINDTYTISINLTGVWQGNDNPVTVIIPNATGSVLINLNDAKNYTVDLTDGVANMILPAGDLNMGVNIVTVSYGNLTVFNVFNVLNGTVTKDNVFSYFDQSNNGKLFGYVPEGVTLDFRGEILVSELGKFNIYINKAVNIISSTENAYIDLNTTAVGMEGENVGNRFTIDKNGSKTNVTGITLHNTQVWLTNTDHVTLDNISVIVLNQKVGSGVGVTSIRDNSSYITIKNSYFSTYNNGGSSTLVLAWANYCTVENNIITAEGNVGNLFYLNTFNVHDIPDGALVNSYNTIRNNVLYGPSHSSVICRGMAYMGTYNLIENNTIYYSGEGIFPSDNGEGLKEVIITNNRLYNGSSMSIISGVNVYNNYVSGNVNLRENSRIYNNTIGGLNILGDGAIVEDTLINGSITIGAIADAQIRDSIIIADITIPLNAENITISGNTIEGSMDIKYTDNKIIGNRITSTKEYAITFSNSKAKNNIVSNNTIYAAVLYGNEAVNDGRNYNTVKNNRPSTTELDAEVSDIKVGDVEVVKIFLNNNATGSVKIIFNGSEHLIGMVNGLGTYNIPDLSAGTYSVKIVYSGDGYYAAKELSKTFTVSKYEMTIDGAVSVAVVDNSIVKFDIDLVSDVTGSISVNIAGNVFSDNLIQGKSTINVNDLDAGKYNATVSYSGDDKYVAASTVVAFIIKSQTDLLITVNDIYVGETANVQLSSDNRLNGEVILTVDKQYIINLIDGAGSLNISGLRAGNYTVQAMFNGNEEFLANSSTAEFKVSKNNLSAEDISMVVENNEAIFTSTLANDATGELIITVNNQNYTSSVVNGQATVKPDLRAGSHSALITYSGDDKYNPVSKSVDFIIKASADLSINVVNIFVGEIEIVNIEINDAISTGVTVDFNGQYPVDLVNGKGKVTFSDLTAGNYTVKAMFEGNEYFLANETEATFSVSKISLPDNIIIVDGSRYSIDLPADATGSFNVVVGDKNYSKPVANGTAVITVDDLKPNTYEVAISYSGDVKYMGISKSTTLTVPKYESTISVTVDDIYVGESAVFNVVVPDDATGIVSVVIDEKTYNSTVFDGKAVVNVSGLANGTYNVVVKYLGDNNYLTNQNSTSIVVSKIQVSDDCFEVSGSDILINLPGDATGNLIVDGQSGIIFFGKAKVSLILIPGNYSISASYSGDNKYMGVSKVIQLSISKYSSTVSGTVENIHVGEAAVFNVVVPDDATGIVSIVIDNKTYNSTVSDGKAIITVEDLAYGLYLPVIKYLGDTKYFGSEYSVGGLLVSKNALSDTVLEISSSKVSITLPDDATGNLTVYIDGKLYNAVKITNGEASIAISGLSVGDHIIQAGYIGDGKYWEIYKSITVNIPAPHIPVLKLTGSNVNMLYTSGTYYKVRLTSDGVGLAGKTVTFVVNGKKSTVRTDSKGWASVKINLPPKSTKYSVSASYSNLKTSNKVKVNSILVAKNVNVKKSAKKLTIKVTLKKVNKKYLKSKKITLKFNGKKYTAKTNKKGVAKFKLNKKVIKKLKAGKKYTYQVTYLKDSVKKTLTVKK